ncbi:MAG: hypothetical protein ACP5QS_08610, partial [bacterium]
RLFAVMTFGTITVMLRLDIITLAYTLRFVRMKQDGLLAVILLIFANVRYLLRLKLEANRGNIPWSYGNAIKSIKAVLLLILAATPSNNDDEM